MTDLIYDYITMGIDMMISAVILSTIVILLRSSSILSNYTAQQQATADRLGYYRQYASYDCTSNLLSPDVVSAMVYYKNSLSITIQMGTVIVTNDTSTGKYYIEGGAYGSKHAITFDELNAAAGVQKQFSAVLFEDFSSTGSTSGYRGGTITGIKFVQIA